jgi:hypothetical protein
LCSSAFRFTSATSFIIYCSKKKVNSFCF